MFTPDRKPGDPWTDDHQYLYSLLWSSFLDLDAYSASRFRRRFFPYSTEFVVRELLWDIEPEVRKLGIGDTRSRLSNGGTPRLSRPFVDLALWTVVPSLFGRWAYGDPSRPQHTRDGSDDFERVAGPLRRIVADQLHSDLDIEVAAFRFDADARPLLPPGLGLGIENPKIDVVAGRRCATADLSADVNVSYDTDAAVVEAVDPMTWSIFAYWSPPQTTYTGCDPGTVEMELVLPGGNSAAENKWRPLRMAYSTAKGPFGARVDFDCLESQPPSYRDPEAAGFESRRACSHSGEDPPEHGRYYDAPYAPDAMHVRQLRGYLKLEKIEGRPGWTRLVAQREGRFESPNHDRFRVETLMFWLTCDLLSFAQKYAYPKDDRT